MVGTIVGLLLQKERAVVGENSLQEDRALAPVYSVEPIFLS